MSWDDYDADLRALAGFEDPAVVMEVDYDNHHYLVMGLMDRATDAVSTSAPLMVFRLDHVVPGQTKYVWVHAIQPGRAALVQATQVILEDMEASE